MLILFGLSKHKLVVNGVTFLHDRNNLSFLIPYYEMSSLDKYLFIDDDSKIKCVEQIILAVKHLHSNNILHLDIKPQNILVVNNGNNVNFILTDFSLSMFIKGNYVKSNKSLISPCYRPYVNLKGSNIYSFSSDFWSVGIIINEIFSNCNFEDNFVNSEYIFEESIVKYIDSEIKNNKWPPKQIYDYFLKIEQNEYVDNTNLTRFINLYSFNLLDIEEDILNKLYNKYYDEINNLYFKIHTNIPNMMNYDCYIFSLIVILSSYGHSSECFCLLNQSNNLNLNSYIDSLTNILSIIGFKIN